MATDLERLVVQLSADIKGYENALNKAKVKTDQSTRAIENRFRTMNKNIETSFAGMNRSVSRLGAGLVAGLGVSQLTRMVREVAAAGDALGDLADQTGASVEAIQVLRYAAVQTGASAEQMDTAIAKLAVNLGEAAKGGGDLKKMLDANGISLTDATGKMRSFDDIMRDITELVKNAPNDFAALEVVTTAFGAKNDELVTTLRGGVAGLDEWGKKLQQTAGIMDRDGVDALSELDAKWNEATASMQAALKRLVVATGPLIGTILDEVIKFAHTLGEIADTIDLLFKGEFAAAGRLASHGRETAVETNIRERRELETQIAQMAADRVAAQGQLNTALEMGGLTLDEIAAKQKELNDLAAKELELRQKLVAMPRPDLAPMAGRPGQAPAGADAVTVIPVKGASGRATTGSPGLKADFDEALANMMAAAEAAGIAGTKINSGYRTFQRQAELFDAAVKKYGSVEAARKWVAPPGKSMHNQGFAADLGFGSDAARQWFHENAAKFGLTFPMGHEPWHIESAEARGQAIDDEFKEAYEARAAADKKAAEDRERAAADYQAIVDDRLAALDLTQKEIDLFGQGEQVLDEQRILHEQMLKLKELGLENDTAAVAAAQAYAAAMASGQAQLETMRESEDATIERLDTMRDLSSDVFGGIVSDLRAGASAGEIFANVLDKIIAKLGDMAVNMLTAALFGQSGTTQTGLLGSLFGGLFGAPAIAGARASGGPVMAGSSYMVGEQGPEIFTPSVGGSILPNRGGAMGGELRGVIAVQPSPFFITSVQMATGRMISENNRRMPAYLADRQRRGI